MSEENRRADDIEPAEVLAKGAFNLERRVGRLIAKVMAMSDDIPFNAEEWKAFERIVAAGRILHTAWDELMDEYAIAADYKPDLPD